MMVLLFGEDFATIEDTYTGPAVYGVNLVIPLKKNTEELAEKIRCYSEEYYKGNITEKDLVKYCLDNNLVIDSNIDRVRREYNILK